MQTLNTVEGNELDGWLGATTDAANAAADFLRLDSLVKDLEAEKAAARERVIATFDAAGIDRLDGVVYTQSEKRSFDHEAAARLDIPTLTEPKTSAALVDAALLAGTINNRQYSRIVTTTPSAIVQAERVRKTNAA